MAPTGTPTRAAMPRGPVRRTRRGLGRLAAAVGATVTAGGVAIAAVVVLGHVSHGPAAARCTVSDSGVSYTVTPEQAGNAATIAAVAVRAGLPDHAVTIALSTALQESKLRNLSYGDRDSIGLFQQRPSQGWGTAAQVADPVYASTAFYRALVKLPNWQADDVATAAQAVQRSADGSAYASWENEARGLAVALTGEQPAAITCAGGTLSTAKATSSTTTAAVRSDVATALGSTALTPGADATLGRAAAAWLVAHSQADSITRVAYDGYQWTAARGSWVTDAAAGTAVDFTLAPASKTTS